MKNAISVLILLFSVLGISAQINPPCPKITVTGPAGVTVPGDSIAFKASVDDSFIPPSARFEWTVSTGTIESGQGTSSITVRIPNDLYGYQIKAVVKIAEPFNGCKESLTAEAVAESAPFVCGLAPDDYPKLNRNEERARLLNAAYLWSRDPQDVLVFVIHVATSETAENAKRRAAFIRDFFLKDKVLSSYGFHVPADRVSIVFTGSEQTHTSVYLIPLGGIASFTKGFSLSPKVAH